MFQGVSKGLLGGKGWVKASARCGSGTGATGGGRRRDVGVRGVSFP